MKKKTVQQSRLWLWFGIAAAGMHFLYGIGTTFTYNSFGIWMLNWIDWLAASMPYFFFGALAGQLWSRQKFADWTWAVLAFWLLVDVAAFALATPHAPSRIALFLFFPLVYGSFFTSFAWAALLSEEVLNAWAKYVLSGAYLAIFGSWLYLQLKQPTKWVLVRRVLLAILLLVLLLGAVSCASQLNG